MRIGTRVQFIEDWVASEDPDDYTSVPVLRDGVGTVIEVKIEPDMDGYDRTIGATVRWDSGEVQTFGNDEHNGPIWDDLHDVTPKMYVNVYLMNRAMYSAAEGGCWYDYGTPELEQCHLCGTQDEVDRTMKTLQAWCDDENAHRRSDISSVISEGKFIVCNEAWPAQPWPACKPHYC